MKLNLIFCLISLFNFVLNAGTISFNEENSPVTVNVISESDSEVIIQFKLNHFKYNQIDINNKNYQFIYIPDEVNFLNAGEPALPHINRSIIIPDKGASDFTIIDSNAKVYSDFNASPSKGNIKRNIDISKINYQFGEVYSLDKYYPEQIVELRDPYILRDFRGQVIQFNPIQFNPVKNTLNVIYELTVKISFDSKPSKNEFDRSMEGKNSLDFHNIYQNQFINYTQTRYTPISEDGEMLIICYDSFMSSMDEFVDWKNQKGIKTTMVAKTEAGSSASSIKNYVQSFYNAYNLTYLLLVGDKTQIPTFSVGGGWSAGESDVSYAYISGNDSYPEFLVGRLSAENTSHVNTVVERTIEYERDAVASGSWYHKGITIASNEGAGAGHDGGESDWQHARNMRTDLLNYNYTEVAEFYDGTHSGGSDASGNPSDTAVRNAINDGVGIIHYTGHGETQSWVTSNFNVSDANALTNQNQLPFICTVGCKSGDFGDGTSLGEAFIRATSNGEPTGAIATFMSTIYQGWAPPMEAQDEMVDILVESYSSNRKYSFGGISWNGCLKMNDAYGSSGYDETDHWTLFGDPSVVLRTDTPENLSITHSGSLNPAEGAYEVIINGNHDNVLASLSYNGNYLGASYADNGVAVIVLEENVDNYSNVTLTVTGYNTTTFVENVNLGSPCDSELIGDANEDGSLNVLDIVTSVNYILNISDPSFCSEGLTDINSDGILNILDIISIVNLILG